jgi:hypothetical protein
MITAKNLSSANIDFSKLPTKFKEDYGDIVEMVPYMDQEPDFKQVINSYVAGLNAELSKAKPKAAAKKKPAAKKPRQSSADKAKKAAEIAAAKRDVQAMQKKAGLGEFAKFNRSQILEQAQAFHKRRRLSAQAVDEAVDHKKRLTPTPENLVRWMNEPGKFDLIGVDTFEKNNPTADLKIKKEIFWHRLLKK